MYDSGARTCKLRFKHLLVLHKGLRSENCRWSISTGFTKLNILHSIAFGKNFLLLVSCIAIYFHPSDPMRMGWAEPLAADEGHQSQ